MKTLFKWGLISAAALVALLMLVYYMMPEEERIRIENEQKAKVAAKYLSDSLDQVKQLAEKKAQVEADSVDQIEEPETVHYSIGDEMPITYMTPGCATKEVLDEFMTLAVAKDNMGIEQLEKSGLIAPLEPGTVVKIIDSGFGWRRVRVLNGRYKGLGVFIVS
jgi:hypothetical protein